MRFQRRDLVGMTVAITGPVLLFLLVVESYQLWDHHGSPLLAIIATNVAVGGGLIGAFWRFVRSKDAVVGIGLALILTVAAVLLIRRGDAGGGAFETTLKLLGVLLFLLLNITIAWQLLVYGLNPLLQRRDDRRAARAETLTEG